MKSLSYTVTIAAVAALLAVQPARAELPELTAKQKQAAVINYRECLQCTTAAVRKCAIGFIRSYKLAELTDELINILENDSSFEVRIAAARALAEIGGTRGVVALRTTSRNSDEAKLSQFCETLLLTDEFTEAAE